MSTTEALGAADAAALPLADIQAVSDQNGRRWRVEGPGWTMQPEGELTARQAEAICRTTAIALMRASWGAPILPPILPATRSATFTLFDLAEAIERGPTDLGYAHAHAIAGAQAWAISAAMWREVDRQGGDIVVTEDGVTLHELARACQWFPTLPFIDAPTSESPAGRFGTSGQSLYMFAAGAAQAAAVANALRSYASDLQPSERHDIHGTPYSHATRSTSSPPRPQAPGRDLEDDGA